MLPCSAPARGIDEGGEEGGELEAAGIEAAGGGVAFPPE
ncbi:hypothetical protein D187_006199 [Cystobacter fuscus DSM 2262]|uniref:Uncharacterized protein n=1 Tax=Cystobacter fuscus (strain ATCC 25194 / DSM 2262 / NBRC 100088 / M29) TaxID=1242864 RepID=S9P2U9_CYSF2|nr:hypothetical protein D187_006199 [Cystobacter fuscus DSM 2262]